MDLKEAYRNIPVHLADRHLLAVKWNGITFLDGALPFGLRSAPKLFSVVADGLLWIFFNHGIQPALHYLDDFVFLGLPGKSVCRSSIQKALQLCNVGVPVAVEKTEGPATTVEPHYNGHLGAKSSWLLYRGGLFTEWHSKSS